MDQADAGAQGEVLDYLEQLVIAGISDRNEPANEVAGRVVAVLLEALTAAGGAERAEGYLAPEPGATCRLQWVDAGATGWEGDEVPVTEVFDRLAGDLPAGTGVIAVGDDGLRRRVLEVSEDGAPVFVFPEPPQFRGPQPALDAALRRWSWTVRTWGRRPLSATASRDATSSATGASQDRLQAQGPPPFPPASAPAAISPTEIIDAVRTALSEVALEVDLGAIDVAVAEAVRAAMPAPPEPLDTDALVARLAGSMPAPPEPLDTDALVARLAGSMPAPPEPLDTDALVARLAGNMPAPPEPLDVDRLSDRVAEAVAGRLPATPPDTSPEVAAAVLAALRPHLEALAPVNSGLGVAEAALSSAADQLAMQLQAFAERVSAGTRTLTSLAEELVVVNRDAAAYADRLAGSLGTSVERLGRQIDRRLNEMQGVTLLPRPAALGPAPAPTGSAEGPAGGAEPGA